MLLLCPSCDATYDVPDARMRPGRKVRCTQCGGEWVPVPLEDAVPPPVVDVHPAAGELPPRPVVTAADRLGAKTAERKTSRALRAAWAASVLAIVAGLSAGLIWRGAVMEHWPPSGRLYGMLGLSDRGPVKAAAPRAGEGSGH